MTGSRPGVPARASAVRAALGQRRWDELRAEAERLRPELPKRLFLTVTPGRSGTGALAHLLSGFRGVVAAHEPRPSFAEALRAVQVAPGLALEFWVRRKLPAIAARRAGVYAESSHLACLGFLEELTLLALPVELVALARPARQVALSLWQLDTIPGRTLRGHRYYLSPRDPCLRPLTASLEPLHDYQLCYWYALEVEARQAAWAGAAAPEGPPVRRLTTDQLEGADAAALVGARLELGAPRAGSGLRLRLGAARHRNTKAAKKLERSLPTAELERLEAEVERLAPAPPTT